jgi:glycosyltransferase involved in cell wall biosynthesis
MQIYRKHLAKVVVPSRFFLEKFVEWGWSRDQFAYIPNYIDALQFSPNPEPGSFFLYLGRLAPEKGLATLMRAAKLARVKLKVAGSGPLESELHALQGELDGDVEFLGFRSGEDLHALIREARAVVLPSEWYENAPMSVLESFASGTPVIGAGIGGIPELIEDGETGWCFESGNISELTEALRAVQQMPNSAVEQIGKAARALVEQRFNPEGYVSSMLTLYSSLGVPSNGERDR